ncbi:hypothetical protein H0H92_013558 [Tricholoma furcatifolium]|nr:hypothetical protein H0H92_013558 [Tricholoma furcatifolium]
MPSNKLCSLWCLLQGEERPFEIVIDMEKNIYALQVACVHEQISLQLENVNVRLWLEMLPPRIAYTSLLGEASPFEVKIDAKNSIYALQECIQQKKSALQNIDASHVQLWLLHDFVGILPLETLSDRLPQCPSEFLTGLPICKSISECFSGNAPTEGCIHIIVGRDGATHLPRVARSQTVSALYHKLNVHRFLLVRGTPGTGKSSLCQLLARFIRILEPTTTVIHLRSWPSSDSNEPRDWRQLFLPTPGTDPKFTVLILDEAQLSYSDKDLWVNFLRLIHVNYRHCRAILFASYGSPTTRIKIERSPTPIAIPVEQKVGLRAAKHQDGLAPAGLLFTRAEYDELISATYRSDCMFDDTFFENLYIATNGHIGAILDFVRIILSDQSYREIRGQSVYTWSRFLQCVSPQVLLERLGSCSVFARGLPPDEELQNLDLVVVFEAVLRAGFITEGDVTDAGGKRALSKCFCNGWLHTDLVEGRKGYAFSSSLHQWYVEWKLWGGLASTPPFNATNLLDFAVSVIRTFSPEILVATSSRRIGPGFIERPPEAQYQDEFYRSCHKYANGSIITFPGYGPKEGHVDFFVPSRQWGIELLRDGNQLENHSGRFSSSGPYGATMSFTDYIILDFRVTAPQKRHPQLSKLYHVIFTENFTNIKILNNNLQQIPNGRFRLMFSS